MSRRDAEQRARQLYVLDAARSLLETQEVEQIRMDDIAKAAEYTRRTLYAYFPSRDDLLFHLLVDYLERRWETQRSALSEGGSAPQRLAVWAGILMRFWVEHPQAMRLERYWDDRGIDKSRHDRELFARFTTLNGELAEALRRVIQTGVSEGSLRRDLDLDATVSQFVYSVRAIVGRALSASYSFAEFDPDTYVRHFLDLFLRGICSGGKGLES